MEKENSVKRNFDIFDLDFINKIVNFYIDNFVISISEDAEVNEYIEKLENYLSMRKNNGQDYGEELFKELINEKDELDKFFHTSILNKILDLYIASQWKEDYDKVHCNEKYDTKISNINEMYDDPECGKQVEVEYDENIPECKNKSTQSIENISDDLIEKKEKSINDLDITNYDNDEILGAIDKLKENIYKRLNEEINEPKIDARKYIGKSDIIFLITNHHDIISMIDYIYDAFKCYDREDFERELKDVFTEQRINALAKVVDIVKNFK